MKKLLKFMACALAVSFGLTACDNGQDPIHPYDSGYNPKGSQLNTSHKLVGQMYGEDGVVEKPEDAQGIVFAVSKDGQTAYLVAFTDAMVVGGDSPNDLESYSYTNREGYFSPAQVWGPTLPSKRDTVYEEKTENGKTIIDTIEKRSAIIHNVDGEINTAQILALFAAAVEKDTSYKLPSSYAAKICHDYYRREWSKKKLDSANNDQLALKWKHTQGQWYLPSIEELGDLMKNRDKINKKYGNKASDLVLDNEYFYMPIGGEQGHAYWSSSEFNVQAAWYCLSRVGDGTDYSGNKRYTYYQKNDRSGIHVRPIRKAPIK
ncbi:MAG: DUF1566 domain-containing protein [Bacteroidales bacterium]|nr:DUF1566 domain-containing protein [Bacteroidales bacterium]